MDLSGSWKYIERIARSRLAHNKTDHHVSRYGDEIEILGAAGELCARRYLGLKEVLHDRFDNGVDFVFAGKKIDVKATQLTPRLEYRYLQLAVTKKIKADLVLLTAVDLVGKQGTVVGWVFREELLEAPINRNRHNPCHEISVRKLHPGWELIQMWRENVQAYRGPERSSLGYPGT